MIAPWFLLFFRAGTQGVEDLHGAEITVQWGPQGLGCLFPGHTDAETRAGLWDAHSIPLDDWKLHF